MKKFLISLVITTTLLSCNKEKSMNGIVKDYGPPELDGCGWVIDVNGEIYKPTNLNSDYKIHELNIKVDFKKLNSTTDCGIEPIALDEIEIIKVH